MADSFLIFDGGDLDVVPLGCFRASFQQTLISFIVSKGEAARRIGCRGYGAP